MKTKLLKKSEFEKRARRLRELAIKMGLNGVLVYFPKPNKQKEAGDE